MFFSKKISDKDQIMKLKKVKIQGVIFKIRKMNPLDHVTGAKVMTAIHSKYRALKEQDDDIVVSDSDLKKVKSHYRDVFMAAVVKPHLSRKENDGVSIFVDDLIQNWDLTIDLYDQINLLTYGKKKIKKFS